MGVNPSNRRLRASKNLAKYGSGGHRLTGGGFGLGNKGGTGFSIIRFRLFHKIKPKSKTTTNMYDKNLFRFPSFRRVECCFDRLLQPINNQPKNNNSLVFRAGLNRR
jgi:hypothetical protein